MVQQQDPAVAELAGRRQWREAEARALLDAWRHSGQTLTAFARHYNIHPERLGRWHRLLRTTAPQPVRFHPVRVARAEGGRADDRDRIELMFTDGLLIRVPHGFDAEDLRRLLAVVEASV